jgi:hypothetical protein
VARCRPSVNGDLIRKKSSNQSKPSATNRLQVVRGREEINSAGGMPGGKGRKRKESCEGADEDLADAPPPRYELRTPILGFHRKQLYAGMAIKRRRRDDAWQYLVHYNGWGTKYDEWVNEDLLYPDTDESRRVAESLRTSAEQQEKQRLARKDEADAMAEDLGSEYVIQIIIPHTLQTHLLKEADFVKDGKVPSARARVGARA